MEQNQTFEINDVLLGRGGATLNHEGNKRYRAMVAHHQIEYLAATKKKEKAAMARTIVVSIQREGGRFLKRDSNGVWVQVTDERAKEKTSQALRERLDVRNQTVRPKKELQRPPFDLVTARIVIIGSGLTGLSTAIALERAGFQQISIYERDVSFDARKEGYGLTLDYNPVGVLQQLQVLDEIADADCPSRSHYFFGCKGEILGYFGEAFTANRGWRQSGNLRVPRQRVRQILLNQLKHTKINWGKTLVDLQPSKRKASVARLFFEKQDEKVEADVVVAADGIRSTVVQKWLPTAPPPQPVGVRLILGLTEGFEHPLLHERGFYTLAEGKRLNVMPFSAPSPFGDDKDVPLRYMWQISFQSEETKSQATGKELLQEALDLTQNWHEPVQSMIRSTPTASIWGTQLYDRDPSVLENLLLEKQHSRCPQVVIAGDALHAMSPFKGQGASQCLADGITIAKWLTQASPEAAVKSCVQELVQRTAPIVQASREAAQYWHSKAAMQSSHSFASDVQVPLKSLQGITAETPNLDARVAAVVNKQRGGRLKDITKQPLDGVMVQLALGAVAYGDRGRLRELSWNRFNSLRDIRIPDGSTLVHLAAQRGGCRTVHWLVTEAGCDARQINSHGQTALAVTNDPEVRQFLEQWTANNDASRSSNEGGTLARGGNASGIDFASANNDKEEGIRGFLQFVERRTNA
jgi:salicylate hydroxylase